MPDDETCLRYVSLWRVRELLAWLMPVLSSDVAARMLMWWLAGFHARYRHFTTAPYAIRDDALPLRHVESRRLHMIRRAEWIAQASRREAQRDVPMPKPDNRGVVDIGTPDAVAWRIARLHAPRALELAERAEWLLARERWAEAEAPWHEAEREVADADKELHKLADQARIDALQARVAPFRRGKRRGATDPLGRLLRDIVSADPHMPAKDVLTSLRERAKSGDPVVVAVRPRASGRCRRLSDDLEVVWRHPKKGEHPTAWSTIRNRLTRLKDDFASINSR